MDKNYDNLTRVLFDKNTGEFLTGNDITYDGQVLVAGHVQSEASRVWSIQLPVVSIVVLTFVYKSNGDGTFTSVRPNEMQIVSPERLNLIFKEEIAGIANIVLATEATNLIPILPPTPPSPTVTTAHTVTPTPSSLA